MKTRYVFQAWPGIPGLGSYSVLEARIGSLRLLVPSSGSYGLHLLTLIGVGFGYIIGFVLVAGSPYYQDAAPWRNPWVSIGISITFVVGFFLVLFWEERSFTNWTLRLATRNPRRFKQVQAYAIRPGRFFQEIFAVVDGQELSLKVEGSLKNVRIALSLAKIVASEKEARRVTVDYSLPHKEGTRFGQLFQRVSQTSLNIPGSVSLLFIGSLFALYVWNFLQDPSSWVWRFAIVLFGWMVVVVAQAVSRSRRFYCYNCDNRQVFFRKQGEWRCHKCGQATAL